MKKLSVGLLLAFSIGAQAQTFKVNNLNVTGAGTFASRPVFNGNTPWDSGNLTPSNYLTTATAASTYLSQASAASTYVPLASIGTMAAQSAASVAITGGSVSGIAIGGSLTGTLPNPTIATGAVSSANLASGAASANVGTLGGDLSGTLPNPTVAKSGGNPIAQILAQSGVPSSVTGTTAETTLATIAVPAGAMGTTGSLRIKVLGDVTVNGDAKTLKVYFGGTLVYTVSLPSVYSVAREINIFNRGSATSQVTEYSGGSGVSTQGGSSTTLTINTALAQNITITGTLGTSTDTITLTAYTVELLP